MFNYRILVKIKIKFKLYPLFIFRILKLIKNTSKVNLREFNTHAWFPYCPMLGLIMGTQKGRQVHGLNPALSLHDTNSDENDSQSTPPPSGMRHAFFSFVVK